MRLVALLLSVALPALLPAGAAAQATLNKCIDAEGRVTYSNLPCRGAREVKRVEIDPPPPPPKPAPARSPLQPPAPAQPTAGTAPPPAPSAPTPTAPLPEATPAASPAAPLPPPTPSPAPPPPIASPLPVPTRATTPPPAPTPAPPRAESPPPVQRAAPRTCDALTDQLGRVLDQMDAAQRQGVSPRQMDAWRQEIRELERRKTEAGCF